MKVYVGIFKERGQIVFEDEAKEYVEKRGLRGDMDVIIPWFFSVNWIEKESPDEECGRDSLLS